jgi:hypothetical protein
MDLNTITTEELFKLSPREIENLTDPGLRHKSGLTPSDYRKHILSITRHFGYATRDDSWGEIEKELSIMTARLIKAENKLKELGIDIHNDDNDKQDTQSAGTADLAKNCLIEVTKQLSAHLWANRYDQSHKITELQIEIANAVSAITGMSDEEKDKFHYEIGKLATQIPIENKIPPPTFNKDAITIQVIAPPNTGKTLILEVIAAKLKALGFGDVKFLNPEDPRIEDEKEVIERIINAGDKVLTRPVELVEIHLRNNGKSFKLPNKESVTITSMTSRPPRPLES